MSHLSDSPFDTLEDAFALLCAEPRPLVLEAGLVPGLPGRPLALTELRAVLLHPSTGYRVRNQAIAVLLARARAEGGSGRSGWPGCWSSGCAGPPRACATCARTRRLTSRPRRWPKG